MTDYSYLNSAIEECPGDIPEKYYSDELFRSYALERNPHVLKYFDPKYITRDIYLKAVKLDGRALKYVPIDIRDYELVFEAVSDNGDALKYADDYRLDKEIVLKAVSNPSKYEGDALKYAGNYRSDKDIVIQAVKSNTRAIEFADPILQIDPDVLLETIQDKDSWSPSHLILKYTPDHLKLDPVFLERVDQRNPMYSYMLSPSKFQKILYLG
jgi:hypothetical protein